MDFWVAVVAVTIIWAASWFVVTRLCLTYTERGQFGDMFGAVNSLFSGLAFALLIVTLRLQHRELQLQQEELRAAREQYERSAAAEEDMHRAMVKATHAQTFLAIREMLQSEDVRQDRGKFSIRTGRNSR